MNIYTYDKHSVNICKIYKQLELLLIYGPIEEDEYQQIKLIRNTTYVKCERCKNEPDEIWKHKYKWLCPFCHNIMIKIYNKMEVISKLSEDL